MAETLSVQEIGALLRALDRCCATPGLEEAMARLSPFVKHNGSFGLALALSTQGIKEGDVWLGYIGTLLTALRHLLPATLEKN